MDPEFLMTYSLPTELARQLQGVLFQAAPASELTTVRSAYCLGKWKEGRLKPRAVLVVLMSVGAKHTTCLASSQLRAARMRLDEDLTPRTDAATQGPVHRLPVSEGQGLQAFLHGGDPEVQG